MIASVLGVKYNTLKTAGNFNNEVGLPLTVFNIRKEHEAAVLEMGISDFGEMHRLSKIARPNLCVITNIGLCHLEFLGDRDGVLRAKSEIFDFAAAGAKAIVNGDDDKLSTLKSREDLDVTLFGMDSSNDVYAKQVENLGLDGLKCVISTPVGEFSAHIHIPGMHMVYNALAGTCVGLACGLTLEEIKSGIENAQTISGRNNLIHTENYTIMDDCYNANPVSMKASLDVLSTALGRKVAILGDMGELGTDELALHYTVGEHAAGKNIDYAFYFLFCSIILKTSQIQDWIKCFKHVFDFRIYGFHFDIISVLWIVLRFCEASFLPDIWLEYLFSLS